MFFLSYFQHPWLTVTGGPGGRLGPARNPVGQEPTLATESVTTRLQPMAARLAPGPRQTPKAATHTDVQVGF